MTIQDPESNSTWKSQNYLLGGLAGLALGLTAAYMYTRAVIEDVRGGGSKEHRIQTGELITIALAVLALIRQIAELGRTPQSKRRR